jgi:hypothetical protein
MNAFKCVRLMFSFGAEGACSTEWMSSPIPEATYPQADQPRPECRSPRRADGHRRHFEFAAAPIGFRWRSAFLRLLDLVQDAYHSVLDLIREILDAFASAYGIRCIGYARFVSDNLLRAKRNPCRFLGRQA